jgi:hypothetical protein
MIKISTGLSDLLLEQTVESFFLVDLNNGFRKTSNAFNITYNGNLYIADGTLLTVEPPQMSSIVDRQAFKIVMSDVNMEMGVLAEAGMLGTPVNVYMGFINIGTDQPHTELDKFLTIYSGHIDGVSYRYDTSLIGERAFILTCTTPMSDLDLKKPIYTSQDYLDKNYPGDTSYQQIYEGSGPIELRWGKI